MAEINTDDLTTHIIEANKSPKELKARKAVSKLGLVPVTGINRVVMRRARNQLVVLANAEVYKSPVSDTYVIFGEPKTEAPGFPNIQTISPEEAANRQALEQRLQASGAGGEDKPSSADAAPSADSAAAAGGEAAEAEAGEQAAEGLQQSDIDVVMSQAKCSRDRAIKALREQNGEIVNAIMSIT